MPESSSSINLSWGQSYYFYDSGGDIEGYTNKERGELVFIAPVGSVVRLVFLEFDVEDREWARGSWQYYDYLRLYDGNSSAANRIGFYYGSNSPGTVTSTGNSICVKFDSDESIVASGWVARVEVIDPNAPNEADCLGAKTICNAYYDEPSPEINGQGKITNELPSGDCVPDEKNGIWYRFSPQNSVEANLKFKLTPDNSKDDYDWVIFDVTNVSCADLASIDINTSEAFMSGNTYGSNNPGSTGANSSSGSGTCNGPGSSNGPRWNGDILVKPGHDYVLYVSNWSESTNGYRIDFDQGGTAIIYDDVPPNLDGIVQSCFGSNELEVRFSEEIPCGGFKTSDFMLSNGSVEYSVTAISSLSCENDGVSSTTYLLTLDRAISESGQFELSVQARSIRDMCGNMNLVTNIISFDVEKMNPIGIFFH